MISCLVEAGLLFHEMTMETALTEVQWKAGVGRKIFPVFLEDESCLLFQSRDISVHYKCHRKGSEEAEDKPQLVQDSKATPDTAPGTGKDWCFAPHSATCSPSPCAETALGVCVRLVEFSVERWVVWALLFLSRQTLMLYVVEKALLTFRAAHLRCGWNLWM